MRFRVDSQVPPVFRGLGDEEKPAKETGREYPETPQENEESVMSRREGPGGLTHVRRVTKMPN